MIRIAWRWQSIFATVDWLADTQSSAGCHYSIATQSITISMSYVPEQPDRKRLRS